MHYRVQWVVPVESKESLHRARHLVLGSVIPGSGSATPRGLLRQDGLLGIWLEVMPNQALQLGIRQAGKAICKE
jgi:hypothetical protein